MKIKFFCPRWGFENISWEKFLADVKKEGYAGIEWFPFARKEDFKPVLQLLREHELEFAIVMAVLEHYDHVDDYFAALTHQLLELSAIRDNNIAPVHISAQTGREYFTGQQVEGCLQCCDEVSRQSGIPIYHETHRNKWTFAAHAVHPFLKKHPDLLLTLDVSHWFCVSESYLHDQAAAVERAVRHTRHIHARVGHIEGPQVWDPAAPEYAQALEEHLKVWDKWIETRKQAGAAACTITPEFGPPPYMVVGDRKISPEKEQWRLNNWMKSLLEERYR